MRDLKVRKATAEDSEDLTRVHLEAWRSAYHSIFPASFLDALQVRPGRWREKLDLGVGIDVALIDSRIVGYCSRFAAEEPGWAELRAIYVAPDAQGIGVGTELMAAAESEMSRSHGRALLWVIDRNAGARRFYERRGWARGAPIRIEDIGGTQVTLVRYEIDLRESGRRHRDLPDG